MAEDESKETIKVKLEIPKDQVSLVSLDAPASEEDEEEDKSSSLVEKATGYKAGEIVSAPLSKPKVSDHSQPVSGQIRNILAGLFLVIMSLIAWPIFGFATAMAVVLVGASFIAFGTLVRV